MEAGCQGWKTEEPQPISPIDIALPAIVVIQVAVLLYICAFCASRRSLLTSALPETSISPTTANIAANIAAIVSATLLATPTLQRRLFAAAGRRNRNHDKTSSYVTPSPSLLWPSPSSPAPLVVWSLSGVLTPPRSVCSQLMAQRTSAGAHLRGLLITLPWVLYLLLADVLLSFLLPFAVFAPRAVYEASSQIALPVWAWIQRIFESFNGARIETSGDSLPKGESAIVVANHVAWSDFYMIQALAQRSGMLGYCRYFAKSQLKAVPFLGWGLWAMGMPLVSRNWLHDKAELDRVFSGIVNHGFPTCQSAPSWIIKTPPKRCLSLGLLIIIFSPSHKL